MNIPLSPRVPENLVSRDGFSRPVPRQPAHLHTPADFGAYLRDSSRVPRRRPFMKPPYAIGSVPSLSGHANAYRWHSLPRVRWHRASKPQGSSKQRLPWQVTMDQLICAFLSRTHYRYEVGMLKVPACTHSVGSPGPKTAVQRRQSDSSQHQNSSRALSNQIRHAPVRSEAATTEFREVRVSDTSHFTRPAEIQNSLALAKPEADRAVQCRQNENLQQQNCSGAFSTQNRVCTRSVGSPGPNSSSV